MEIDAIMIKERDNVATALRDIQPKESAVIGIGDREKQALVKEYIPYGHKFAAKDIRKDANILKYGEIIGRATQNIASGTHVHVHNIESLRGRGDLELEEA